MPVSNSALGARYRASAVPGSSSFGAPVGPARPGPLPPAYRPLGAEPPGVAMVVVITFLFGIFGVIPAATRAGRAKAVGASTSPYWIAFAVTTVVSWVLGFVVFFVLLFAGLTAAGTPA